MVRMGHGRVLEEVLDEEDIARDALDGFDQEVIESQATLAVLGSLLSVCVWEVGWEHVPLYAYVWLMGVHMCSLCRVCLWMCL